MHLFVGAGGGILGDILLGHRPVCAVEIEEYPRKVLLQRQRDGILPRFPLWDDVRTFDGRPWRGRVDLVSGGFPCQDISCAGPGTGLEGERSGLWFDMARIIGEVLPQFVQVENSPRLISLGLDRVLSDLTEMGYGCRWGVIGAHHAGAPHKRNRIWIVANNMRHGAREGYGEVSNATGYSPLGARRRKGPKPCNSGENVSNSNRQRSQIQKERQQSAIKVPWSAGRWWEIDPAELPDTNQQHDDNSGYDSGEVLRRERETSELSKSKKDVSDSNMYRCTKGCGNKGVKIETQPDGLYTKRFDTGKRWFFESRVGRVAHGVANRVDRIKAIGNGQVPAVAALAFTTLLPAEIEE